MKTMDKIINKNLFINAYRICSSYASDSSLNDINILLLRNSFSKLTEKKLLEYYNKYIVKYFDYRLQNQNAIHHKFLMLKLNL